MVVVNSMDHAIQRAQSLKVLLDAKEKKKNILVLVFLFFCLFFVCLLFLNLPAGMVISSQVEKEKKVPNM